MRDARRARPTCSSFQLIAVVNPCWPGAMRLPLPASASAPHTVAASHVGRPMFASIIGDESTARSTMFG